MCIRLKVYQYRMPFSIEHLVRMTIYLCKEEGVKYREKKRRFSVFKIMNEHFLKNLKLVILSKKKNHFRKRAIGCLKIENALKTIPWFLKKCIVVFIITSYNYFEDFTYSQIYIYHKNFEIFVRCCREYKNTFFQCPKYRFKGIFSSIFDQTSKTSNTSKVFIIIVSSTEYWFNSLATNVNDPLRIVS